MLGHIFRDFSTYVTSVGLFKCIYLGNYLRYHSEILHTLLRIFGNDFLKISSNSEVVMLEAFVELTWNHVPLLSYYFAKSKHFIRTDNFGIVFLGTLL